MYSLMNHWNNYHLPQTLDEAVDLLAQYDGRARAVAGGTDYFLDERNDDVPTALIDVTRMAGLRDIREADGYIVIGCGVTHTQIIESPLIQQHGTALVEGCFVIGGPQVRNVATLAGNIAHALPAADGTLALLALGGEVAVASAKSRASVPRKRPKPQVQRPKPKSQFAIRKSFMALGRRGQSLRLGHCLRL